MYIPVIVLCWLLCNTENMTETWLASRWLLFPQSTSHTSLVCPQYFNLGKKKVVDVPWSTKFIHSYNKCILILCLPCHLNNCGNQIWASEEHHRDWECAAQSQILEESVQQLLRPEHIWTSGERGIPANLKILCLHANQCTQSWHSELARSFPFFTKLWGCFRCWGYLNLSQKIHLPELRCVENTGWFGFT